MRCGAECEIWCLVQDGRYTWDICGTYLVDLRIDRGRG